MLRYTTLFVVALATLFSATFVSAHSSGEAVAIFTETPPVIDGKDDWPQEVWAQAREHDMHINPEIVPDWFMFPETSPNRVSRGIIDDAKDLSVEFALMFDEEWLYYIGVFLDDQVPDNLESGELDNKASPVAPNTTRWWLEFDYEHDAPKKPKGNDDTDLAGVPDCLYQAGDHYYQFKPWTGAGTTKPVCWESHGQNAVLGGGDRVDVEASSNMAATKTADGFIIEGKLKFKTMFKQSQKSDLPIPVDGTIWGFDTTAEDHEDGNAGREGAISWASSFENDNTVCVFGDLLFVGGVGKAVSARDKLPLTWGKIKKRAKQ